MFLLLHRLLDLSLWLLGNLVEEQKPGQLCVGGLDLFVLVGSVVSVSWFGFTSGGFCGVLGRLTRVG